MKEFKKTQLLNKLKLGLMAMVAIVVLGYVIYFVIDRPKFGKGTLITQILVYPFEKRECKKRGGRYQYNASMNGYFCQIAGRLVPLKPVIYLYPEKKTNVQVRVKYPPGFSVTYPDYKDGWQVVAEPSGTLTNISNGKEYSYLYWEGNFDPEAVYDLSTGFVVPGDQTRYFLEEKLSYLGLIPREYNEFIVYWLPKMEKNPYNLIHFSTETEYQKRVAMEIQPQPDSVIRVFMVFKPLENPVSIMPQNLEPNQRQGFTVVEWGGSEF